MVTLADVDVMVESEAFHTRTVGVTFSEALISSTHLSTAWTSTCGQQILFLPQLLDATHAPSAGQMAHYQQSTPPLPFVSE